MSINVDQVLNSLEAMANGILAQLPYFIIAILVFFIIYFIAQGISKVITSLVGKRQLSLGIVIGRLVRFTILLFGMLLALVIVFPSFTLGRLVELLGIGGVAIGFAFRDILQNFLAGILLLFTEPFKIGDQIIVDDYEGTVEEIQTRATYIRTYDNRRVVIPNGTLFTKSVMVNTAFKKRRIEYDIGLGYDTNIEEAKQIILATMKSLDIVQQQPPPEALLLGLGDSAINMRVRWWISPSRRADAIKTQDIVLVALKEALDAANIDIPFPVQTVLFHNQTTTRAEEID